MKNVLNIYNFKYILIKYNLNFIIVVKKIKKMEEKVMKGES